MAVRCLSVYLLLLSLGTSWAEQQTCPSATSCTECIQGGPVCAWCHDPELPQGRSRCDSVEKLQGSDCGQKYIYYPQSTMEVVKNDSRSSLNPQLVQMVLRPGLMQSVNLSVYLPPDRPVPDPSLVISPLPQGLNITYSTTFTKDSLLIQLDVEASHCPRGNQREYQSPKAPWSILIRTRGLSDSLELQVALHCQCDCGMTCGNSSPFCSGHGALVQGQCICNEPYRGKYCQISPEDLLHTNECYPDPDSDLCSGNGECVMNSCECFSGPNPKERYIGRYCECTNFLCPRSSNKLCSGHGRCECNRCVCHADWTGEDCGCSLDATSCLAANGMICNGRGACLCGSCRCNGPYKGPTCELCPTCLEG